MNARLVLGVACLALPLLAAVAAPLLAAISGPTGLAVRVAEAAGMTLVGFARGGGHVVYTHPAGVVA